MLLLACALSRSWAAEYPYPQAGTAGKGRLEFVQGIPVLHLRGGPEEMGRQQGDLLGRQFAALRSAYVDQFFPGALERNGALAFGLTLVRFMPPDYVAEMKGLADASGVDGAGVIFGNTFTDSFRAIFCSVVLARGEATADGSVLFARNLDFPSLGILHKATVVTVYHHTAEGRHGFVSVGWPGAVGVVSGMNDAGLCLATLVSLSQKGVMPGMPYAMMYRTILEQCATPAEALAMVKRTPRTSANNLAVASPDKEPLVIEFTPAKVAARRPVRGVVMATNHFRSPELAAGAKPSCRRFATLEDQVAKGERLDVPSLQRILHTVNQGNMTLQSMVFEPAARKLHLAIGPLPATAGRYVTLDCAKLLAAE